MSKSPRVIRAHRARRGCLSFLIGVFLCVVGCVLGAAAAVNTVLEYMAKDLPPVTALYYFEPSQTTRIFAADGTLIGTLFRENRTWTRLDKISPNMVQALLAIEDSRFYEHRGVDPIGVLRAAIASYRNQDRQGASTVTMQLAGNLFLDRNNTKAVRKLKEMLLAIRIEQTFTKAEIVEMYLNQMYFGAGAYGVQAASNVYFGKKADKLTVPEAAMLAGLLQSPTTYSPYVDPKMAKIRQEEVLGRMKDVGYLNQQQFDKARKTRLKYVNTKQQEFTILKVPYFTTYVIKQLYKRFDEDTLYRGGFNVYTTVDLKLQAKAEETVKRLVAADTAYLNVHTGSIVCVENKTGYIKAMCGGMGWTRKNQFNRAWQARRQPGSSFKMFVYATALENGFTPDTVVPDSPITIGNWSPKNSDGRFMGSIPMATALQHSRNVVAVRLIQMVGVERVIEYAHQMGIESDLDANLSLALGAVDVSPLEMASAISVFPNQGLKVNATGIKLIKDPDGNIVEDNRIPVQKEVLAESTASMMVDMLKRVVEAGTATNAILPNHEVAGKTGTTDSFRDAWFVGFTRDLTCACWVGNDDFTQMYTSFGGDLPARMFHDFMAFAMKDKKPSTIARGNTATLSCLFCAETNKRAGPSCPKVYRKLMRRYDMPRYFCDLHGAPKYNLGAYAPKDTTVGTKTAAQAPKPTGAPAPNPEDAPIPTQVQLPTGENAPAEVPVNPPGQTGPEPAPVAPEPVDMPIPEPVPVEVPVEAPPAPPPPAPPAPQQPAPPPP